MNIKRIAIWICGIVFFIVLIFLLFIKVINPDMRKINKMQHTVEFLERLRSNKKKTVSLIPEYGIKNILDIIRQESMKNHIDSRSVMLDKKVHDKGVVFAFEMPYENIIHLINIIKSSPASVDCYDINIEKTNDASDASDASMIELTVTCNKHE